MILEMSLHTNAVLTIVIGGILGFLPIAGILAMYCRKPKDNRRNDLNIVIDFEEDKDRPQEHR